MYETSGLGRFDSGERFLSTCIGVVTVIYQWKAYNLRILDIWVKLFIYL